MYSTKHNPKYRHSKQYSHHRLRMSISKYKDNFILDIRHRKFPVFFLSEKVAADEETQKIWDDKFDLVLAERIRRMREKNEPITDPLLIKFENSRRV